MNQATTNKLKQLEKTGWDFRNIAREEGIILNTLIKIARYKNILEAGTSNGYSTIWLAEAAQQNNGHVTTIEIDPKRATMAQQNFVEAQVSKCVTLLKGDSYDIMQQLNEQFDLVFIDGGRDYLEIFNLVNSKLLKPNGILAVDNTISHKDAHKNFLERVQKDDNYQKVVIDFGGGLLVALKLQ